MAKRIIKETSADGTEHYRVETNTRLFGMIKGKWRTDTVSYFTNSGDMITLLAVFGTLEEAEIHVFGKPKSKEIVKREIIDYEND